MLSKGLFKVKKFQKPKITLEAGGWVPVSLGKKVLENHSKIVLTSTDILG